MPIYEYRCSACQHKLESLQRLSDAPLKTCPACGADSLVKLVSAAGFQLKGSGWYATDFKNSGSKPAAKDKPVAGGADKSSEGKGAAADTGTAAKNDTASKSDSGSTSTDSGSKKESTSSASSTPAASSSTTARASE